MEKRTTPRLSIHGDAVLTLCGEDERAPCFLDNVSQGGARFFAARKLAVGSCVELRVESPGDEADILLRAEVLRIQPGKEKDMFDYACRLESVENA